MSVKTTIHLDEDQQIRAIIDETKLSDPMRDHLASCPRCRGEIKRIKQNLNHLGQIARQKAPVMHRKISLPVEKPSKIYSWLSSWRISFGAIAAAAMALFVIWSYIPGQTLHQDSLDIISQVSWADDQFMEEISALTENVLPQVYLDMIEESYLSIDDQFIKSVVPSTEMNSLSDNPDRKGVRPC
jgi:hypothetical protein